MMMSLYAIKEKLHFPILQWTNPEEESHILPSPIMGKNPWRKGIHPAALHQRLPSLCGTASPCHTTLVHPLGEKLHPEMSVC